jgi:hypothetical protein
VASSWIRILNLGLRIQGSGFEKEIITNPGIPWPAVRFKVKLLQVRTGRLPAELPGPVRQGQGKPLLAPTGTSRSLPILRL